MKRLNFWAMKHFHTKLVSNFDKRPAILCGMGKSVASTSGVGWFIFYQPPKDSKQIQSQCNLSSWQRHRWNAAKHFCLVHKQFCQLITLNINTILIRNQCLNEVNMLTLCMFEWIAQLEQTQWSESKALQSSKHFVLFQIYCN